MKPKYLSKKFGKKKKRINFATKKHLKKKCIDFINYFNKFWKKN